jgi:hypothetical protein
MTHAPTEKQPPPSRPRILLLDVPSEVFQCLVREIAGGTDRTGGEGR